MNKTFWSNKKLRFYYRTGLVVFVFYILIFSMTPVYHLNFMQEFTMTTEENLGHVIVTDQIDSSNVFHITLSVTQFQSLPDNTFLYTRFELFSGEGDNPEKLDVRANSFELVQDIIAVNMETLDPSLFPDLFESTWLIMTFEIRSESTFDVYHEFHLQVDWSQSQYALEFELTYIVLFLLIVFPYVHDRYQVYQLKRNLTEEAEQIKMGNLEGN